MARTYLVTGGSGFIGAALVARLVAQGHHVRVLDNNSRGHARRLEPVAAGIEFVEGDIRDPQVVTEAASGVDCICHLAYVNGTEFFYSRPELVLDVAVRGMVNVIDACRANGIGDLVVASSSEVYQSPPRLPTPEDVPLVVPDIGNPRYSYGGGKILCELMAINYGRTGFDRVTVFRPHNVYGADMGWEHVVPQLTLKVVDAMQAQPSGTLRLPIQGDGSQTRAFVHIDDFTDGLMRVIDDGGHLEIYHIGSSEEVSIAHVARAIAAYFGREVEFLSEDLPAGGTQRRCPDIAKLRALGYEPRISFAEGIVGVAEWYAAHAGERPS